MLRDVLRDRPRNPSRELRPLPGRLRSSVAEILTDPASKTSNRSARPGTPAGAPGRPANGSRWKAAIARQPHDLLRLPPAGEARERVGAHEQPELVVRDAAPTDRRSVSTVYEGASRSSSSRAIDQSGRPASASASIATRCRASVGRSVLVRRQARRHVEHAAQPELRSPRPRPSRGARSGPGRTCRRRRRSRMARASGASPPGRRGARLEPRASEPPRGRESRRAPAAPRRRGRRDLEVRQAAPLAPRRIDSSRSGSETASHFDATSTRGRAATSGENARELLLDHRRRRARRRPTRRRRRDGRAARQRSTCFRNRMPSPAPRCAPSMSPGMSATTSVRWSSPRHDAEVRHERRERIVGDLRLGRRDRGDERGLAGVRKADDRDVGEELQLDRRAGARRPAGPACAKRGAWRVGVAKCWLPQPPLPPPASSTRSSGRDEVRDALAAVGVRHDGAERQVRPSTSSPESAVPVRAHPVLAALRAVTGSGGAGGRAC